MDHDMEAEDEDPHACEGCQFTVNLRREGMRSQRSAPFHRIQDCLLPVYGLIRMARDYSYQGYKVCAITWLEIYEGLNLRPYLVNVSRVPWHRLINENHVCIKDLKYHTVNRTSALMATADHLRNYDKDPNMVQAHKIDIAKNLPALQMDATFFAREKEVSDGSRHIIVIKRTKDNRMFRPVGYERLLKQLEHHTGRNVMEYKGREPMVEMIKMFNWAVGVIGYHGAAWVNTYFNAHWHCNVHISTFFE